MAIYNANRSRLIFRRKNDLVFKFLSNGKEIQVTTCAVVSIIYGDIPVTRKIF